MASQFKNRLVGITILVALVVIFLPSIIDGKKTTYQQEFAATPIKPELKEHSQSFTEESASTKEQLVIENQQNETPENEQPASEWKVEEVAPTVVAEEPANKPQTAPAVVAKPVMKTVFEDPAWTIQLGAFQNKANINSLLKKLNKAGFQAHTIPREVMDGQLTRVFVGPNVSKQKLTDMLPRLKSLTSLNGKVVPFSPIAP
ncbi:sporulation protein [Psychromonas sp. B3M02]|uniref:SPOR domain-containing protein n=1 Tax=Psychromonas sp. B3M02 TaxID=2267226 RepID=UPI000DEACC25|nr:SPOR domain-containing protein [Psychromonas sp. B3M02]RBW47152.1 sporulation protein [Psychromonas sp. B3M02]